MPKEFRRRIGQHFQRQRFEEAALAAHGHDQDAAGLRADLLRGLSGGELVRGDAEQGLQRTCLIELLDQLNSQCFFRRRHVVPGTKCRRRARRAARPACGGDTGKRSGESTEFDIQFAPVAAFDGVGKLCQHVPQGRVMRLIQRFIRRKDDGLRAELFDALT
jgi:hypothetical protein